MRGMLDRIVQCFVVAAVFAFFGALAGAVAAAIVGVILMQPAIAEGWPGVVDVYAATLVFGVALGALGGIVIAYQHGGFDA